MSAYYNEREPYCAQWLRNLVSAGLIPHGDVDERDIRDVRPCDVAGYTQCHFFAGLGGWPGAARLAGWPDDRPLWTGSCPCQPFSQAGSGTGFADERHLWPSWHWLIQHCRPDSIAGEQVASPAGLMWLDLVSADLEGIDYECRPVDLPSACVGAPNVRQRLFWVADAKGRGRRVNRDERGPIGGGQDAGQLALCGEAASGRLADANRKRRAQVRSDNTARRDDLPGCGGADGRLADSGGDRCNQQQRGPGEEVCARQWRDQSADRSQLGRRRSAYAGRLGDAGDPRLPHAEPPALRQPRWPEEGRATQQPSGALDPWRELEWLACADGRFRPTQPGIFPLAARLPGDVARLRAAGNAVNFILTAEVISAWMELSA